MHLDKLKTCVHRKKICTPILAPELFVTAKNWNQTKCQSSDEYINKNTVHPYKGMLFIHLKWNTDSDYGMN